jgi:quercetin dioxygenase-like cupin family protein
MSRRPSTLGTRFACALLAAGLTVATASGCAPAREPRSGERAVARTAKPPSEILSPLVSQLLPNAPGKTFTAAVVDFPPDARAVPHRHGDAYVYAYVLDGTVRSKLDDKPMRTYGRGEYWVEQPGAHHEATENASPSRPAKLLVVFISDTGAKLKVDDPPPSADDDQAHADGAQTHD